MENFLMKNRKPLMILFGNLSFLCLILFFLNQVEKITTNNLIGSNWLIALAIIFLFSWYFFFIFQKNNIKTDGYLKNLYLILLIIISLIYTSNFFYNLCFIKTAATNILIENRYFFFLSITTAATGFLVVYKNKKNIEKEKIADKKDWKLKTFLPLSAVLLIALILRVYRISESSFWFDELLHISSLSTIPAYPLGDIYNRALLTNWSILIFTKFFTLNEFFSRFPSVIFSLTTIVCSYFLSRKFLDKKFAIIFSLFLSINIADIVIAQEARYFVYLSFLLVAAQLLLLNNKKFEFIFLALILIFGVNSNFIFILSIVPIIILALFKNKNLIINKKLLLIVATIGLILSAYYIYDKNLFQQIQANNYYLKSLNPIILIIAVSFIPTLNKKTAALYLPSILTISVLSLIKSSLVPSYRYISFLNISLMIISLTSLVNLQKIYSKNKKLIIIIPITIALIINIIDLYKFETTDFLSVKERLTWTRPDYKSWSYKNYKNGAIILSNVPHISNFYVGKTDYFIGNNSFEVSKFDKGRELRSGAKIINEEELKEILKTSCVYILADYKKDYMWNTGTSNFVNKNFSEIFPRNYRVFTYYSEKCVP